MSILFYEANWLVSFLPKSDRLATNTLASCTTSLFYVNLFQRTLSLSLPSRTLSIGVSFKYRSFNSTARHDKTEASFILFIWLVAFVLESGCKGIAFWLTNQIFLQKSCLKTYLFNTCLQLTRVKLLIYLINIRMRARGCVRAHTHRLHVWQVMRYMEHGSCLFEHEFLFFYEH